VSFSRGSRICAVKLGGAAPGALPGIAGLHLAGIAQGSRT
jgi:hypothetical protein